MEERNNIPKTAYDKEYSTQWKREVQFLEDKGINYTYAKRHDKYPVTNYKYTKTPELFLALAEYYNQIRNERTFKAIDRTRKLLPIEKGYIEVKKEDLTKPEKELLNITEQDVDNILKDDTE